jgi:hypothetical protein
MEGHALSWPKQIVNLKSETRNQKFTSLGGQARMTKTENSKTYDLEQRTLFGFELFQPPSHPPYALKILIL